jgi:hypothetical protein
MADSEQDLGAAGTPDDLAASSDDSGDSGDSSGGAATDFPTVEPAPEPDNPRFSTEHEEPQGEPQPLPGGDGGAPAEG